ncbi:MAG: redoxin domain-containing protein [Verrucomicrobiota bacterium JB025]|nr:redoxin domain-containing protein [Verrucomicrobiota bacterium JB025]
MNSIITAIVLAIIGQPAPVFVAKDVKGAEVSLADQKGKVVVLEWVNFGCPFVKKHYSGGNLPKLQETYTGKDVVWISICSNKKDNPRYLDDAGLAERAEKEGWKGTHLINDANGKLGRMYGAKVTPQLFIIDEKGVLVYDGAIDSKATTKVADIATADPLFKNALDAVLAGEEVTGAKNKPYGCGVKY